MEEKILVFPTLVAILCYFYIFSIVCAIDDYGNFQVESDSFHPLPHSDAVVEESDRDSLNVKNKDELDSNSSTLKKEEESNQSSSTVKEVEELDQISSNVNSEDESDQNSSNVNSEDESDQNSSNVKSEEESNQNSPNMESEEWDQNSSTAKIDKELDRISSTAKIEEELDQSLSTAKNEGTDKKSTKLKRGAETYGLREVVKEQIFDFQNLQEDEKSDQSNPKSEESDKDATKEKRESGTTHELTEEHKMRIVELHNLYRSNVTPPAGDMNFMEWDEELESLAQLWADTCIFEHGKPEESYSRGTYGQNLYWGLDSTGMLGVWLWYDERNYYNFHNHSCEDQKMCGHYYAMMWAPTHKIGCAMRKCGYRYNLVCHYYPAVIANTQLYDVSKPCSQCLSNVSNSGILCYNNLCISKDQCEKNPEACQNATCNLECQNCGKLDKLACRCICADGWDSHDCSRVCSDAHERCGKRPGYPTKASCALHQYTVANVLCRKMCRRCNPVVNNFTYGSNVCCNGLLCPKGQVLDLVNKPCRCRAQCPGAICPLEASGVINKNSVSTLAIGLLILYLLH